MTRQAAVGLLAVGLAMATPDVAARASEPPQLPKTGERAPPPEPAVPPGPTQGADSVELLREAVRRQRQRETSGLVEAAAPADLRSGPPREPAAPAR